MVLAAALAGTVMGTQYVSAWHHGHYGHHGGYASAMASGGASTSAGRMHLDEGIKVLKTGDTRGALMHLHIADKILGGGGSNSGGGGGSNSGGGGGGGY